MQFIFEESTYKQIAEYSSISSLAIAEFLRVIRKHLAQGTPLNEIIKNIEQERFKLKTIHAEKLCHMHYMLTKKFRQLLGIEKIN